ncbi:MAG TPA: hypothetical protein VEI97_20435 [bacterium]|nr:hypothetical protein [bacterium]
MNFEEYCQKLKAEGEVTLSEEETADLIRAAYKRMLGGPEPGSRVGAILSEGDGVVRLLGYGVYEGDQPCPYLGGTPNPRIRLDSGQVVWGCECWWNGEDDVKASLEGKQVIMEDITCYRKEATDNGSQA